ncbi:acyltransferase [Flavobacterium rivuli WB 3.3-2 = DSM 21788]|uniref:Acyltransferase n=1 Tax=Flavobacterium rivuli WB 3.3-2 = DSM 21788 TaxID=1121895 RepID=A0A0A2M9E7_9FLAO|nr:acyltransferase [Flavobacterium rivuli]KGO88063.1 acyltransferase [Flavobacterium rivuli WB 3.3-2 = DSM 21788]
MNTITPAAKPHYLILDALRGIAALMVVAFHIFEAHAGGSHIDQIINHGYLAVDFFFMLSGFVIGYAYDDRWTTITTGNFFKRRLVRLQPMVVMGMILGAIGYYFGASGLFPMIAGVPAWQVILTMLIGFTLLPVPPSMDIRGWEEMHPLNGPGWSLFFEYIANILYALFVRKFSKTALSVLVFLSGAALIHYAVTSANGDVIGGWSVNIPQLRIGFTRLMYPFFAGLLLCRVVKISQIKNAFLWSSLLLVLILGFPRVGGADHLWMNGLYDSLSIIFIFPLVIYLGAGGAVHNKTAYRICKFLGDISYPIYITHYVLIYIYTAYVVDNKLSITVALPLALLVFVSSIVIAYACLKLYDEPVRKWLNKKFA